MRNLQVMKELSYLTAIYRGHKFQAKARQRVRDRTKWLRTKLVAKSGPFRTSTGESEQAT